MTHRPCGACRELVPVATGCEHWRPGRSPRARESRRTRAARTAATVTEFERVMGRSYR